MSSNSISVTLHHAISFLTSPLASLYPAPSINKLEMVLSANFTALFAPVWMDAPSNISPKRCLRLSADCLPPRSIYAACIASGIQWFDWISLFGGDFDLFVDAGRVSVRSAQLGSPVVTVWSNQVSPSLSYADRRKMRKTVAQLILEDDKEDEDSLFAMLANEVNDPTYTTPVMDDFPTPTRSSSPMSAISTISTHSRSSSMSSVSSCFSSSGSTSSSSSSWGSPIKDPSPAKPSRRQRAREARVVVDTSKAEVTVYEAAKTSVLGGGVMLGGGNKHRRVNSSTTDVNWRRA